VEEEKQIVIYRFSSIWFPPELRTTATGDFSAFNLNQGTLTKEGKCSVQLTSLLK
jgi:hypothetical protein